MPFTVLAMMTLGLALNGLCMCKSRFDGVEIVSVDGLYVKAESLELLVNRFRAGNFADRAVNLQAVEVDNQAEIIEVVVGCKHSSFPNLTLFNLAIAEQRVNTVVFVINLAGKRHACRAESPDRESRELISMPGCPSYPVTLQHSADVAEFFSSPQRNSRAVPVQRKDPVRSGLWKGQNGLCPDLSGSAGQCAVL